MQGAVVMGVGTIASITGSTLWGLSVRTDNGVIPISAYFEHQDSNPELGVGIILAFGGTAMIITGAGLLSAYAKYNKRALLLANDTATISPIMLNDTRFYRMNVESKTGFGIKLTCNF